MSMPDYAKMIELKLKDLNVEIKTKKEAPSNLILAIAPDGSKLTQLNVDGIVDEFGETRINNLAEHIAKNFKSITCLPLVLPRNIETAEIQTSGDIVIRVIETYVMGSGDNDPYANKVIRRVDILFY